MKAARGKRLQRLRSQRAERSFAHGCETGAANVAARARKHQQALQEPGNGAQLGSADAQHLRHRNATRVARTCFTPVSLLQVATEVFFRTDLWPHVDNQRTYISTRTTPHKSSQSPPDHREKQLFFNGLLAQFTCPSEGSPLGNAGGKNLTRILRLD